MSHACKRLIGATKATQKSLILDLFWYLFELLGPPWGGSGGQGETKWIPETTSKRLWKDFGTRWEPLGKTSGNKVAKRLFWDAFGVVLSQVSKKRQILSNS